MCKVVLEGLNNSWVSVEQIMRATRMEVLDIEIHSTYIEKVKLLCSRLALYFLRTIVIREISSRKLATVLLTAPGIAGLSGFQLFMSESRSLIPYLFAAATTWSSCFRPSEPSLMVALPFARILCTNQQMI